jgi:hypothetical protein
VRLRRPVVDPERAHFAQVPTEQDVLRDAQRTADLHRTVDRAPDRLGAEGLGDRGGLGGGAPLVEFPAGLQDQPAGGRDVDLVVSDHLLHHAQLTEQGTEQASLAGAGHGDVLRTAGDAEPAHAVRHPGGPEPDLGVAEALVNLTEHGIGGHHAVLEGQLDVAAVQALVERVDVPHHLHAGVVRVDQEHRRAAGLAWLSGGARHADREGRSVRARDEPLAAVDPPAACDRMARVARAAGSDPAPGAGSVIAKHDRTSPAASGRR